MGGAGAGGDRSWLSTSSSAKPQPLDSAAVAGTPQWPVGPWNTPAGLTDCLALVLCPGRHPARAHPEAWADALSGTRDPGSPGGAGPSSLRGLGAFTCRMGGPQVPQRLGRDGPRCGRGPDRGRPGAQGSGCPVPSLPRSSLGAHATLPSPPASRPCLLPPPLAPGHPLPPCTLLHPGARPSTTCSLPRMCLSLSSGLAPRLPPPGSPPNTELAQLLPKVTLSPSEPRLSASCGTACPAPLLPARCCTSTPRG